MDPLPEREILDHAVGHADKESERVLNRLRGNDPTLKELTLVVRDTRLTHHTNQITFESIVILQVFEVIATNTSLEILNVEGEGSSTFLYHNADRLTSALSLNTSLKVMRSSTSSYSRIVLGILLASPNLETLTMRYHVYNTSPHTFIPSIEDMTVEAQRLRMHTNLQSLTIEGLFMDSNCGIAFAAAFQGNQTIKTFIMRRFLVYTPTGAVSFVEALPHDHSLEMIGFDYYDFDDDSAVSIVRTLCRKHLKVLSFVDRSTSLEKSIRIVQTLKENEHGYTKLVLFRDDQDIPWQDWIRLEIDKLTWNNRLQVEKDLWVNQFLEQDARTQELLFSTALERANKVDNEQFSKLPNMLFYLIKELPDLIAIRDGH